ncbi:MAG: hypothetical protein KGY99_08465 [Phycisphaerae bacterium]|nr:hypothetical protein [Phycisphaerae bacterium]
MTVHYTRGTPPLKANGQARMARDGAGLCCILYGDKRALFKETMLARLFRRRMRRIRPTEQF